MEERARTAIEHTLAFEGGYVNDPADPGGETNMGISRRSYPSENIKGMTRERAIEIYYADYWQRGGYALLDDDALAGKVFDLGVNMGPSRAHKLLQEAVNRTSPAALAEDGKLGMLTVEACNDHPHSGHLLAELKLGAIEFYTELAVKKGMQKYLTGWIRRALA